MILAYISRWDMGCAQLEHAHCTAVKLYLQYVQQMGGEAIGKGRSCVVFFKRILLITKHPRICRNSKRVFQKNTILYSFYLN